MIEGEGAQRAAAESTSRSGQPNPPGITMPDDVPVVVTTTPDALPDSAAQSTSVIVPAASDKPLPDVSAKYPERFFCPRRSELGGMPLSEELQQEDYWRAAGNTCSWCGSLHPEEFFARVEEGNEVGPTDKNYKAYIGPSHGKFYFQHFDSGQQQRFIDLLNAKRVNIGYPGRFYVTPFFITYAPPPSSDAPAGTPPPPDVPAEGAEKPAE